MYYFCLGFRVITAVLDYGDAFGSGWELIFVESRALNENLFTGGQGRRNLARYHDMTVCRHCAYIVQRLIAES